VCASILKNIFTDWIKSQVEMRNKKLVVDRGLTIQMDPRIAAVFHASTKTSGSYLIFFDRLTHSFHYSTPGLGCAFAQDGLEASTHQGLDHGLRVVKARGGEHDPHQASTAGDGRAPAGCLRVASRRYAQSLSRCDLERPLEGKHRPP